MVVYDLYTKFCMYSGAQTKTGFSYFSCWDHRGALLSETGHGIKFYKIPGCPQIPGSQWLLLHVGDGFSNFRFTIYHSSLEYINTLKSGTIQAFLFYFLNWLICPRNRILFLMSKRSYLIVLVVFVVYIRFFKLALMCQNLAVLADLDPKMTCLQDMDRA